MILFLLSTLTAATHQQELDLKWQIRDTHREFVAEVHTVEKEKQALSVIPDMLGEGKPIDIQVVANKVSILLNSTKRLNDVLKQFQIYLADNVVSDRQKSDIVSDLAKLLGNMPPDHRKLLQAQEKLNLFSSFWNPRIQNSEEINQRGREELTNQYRQGYAQVLTNVINLLTPPENREVLGMITPALIESIVVSHDINDSEKGTLFPLAINYFQPEFVESLWEQSTPDTKESTLFNLAKKGHIGFVQKHWEEIDSLWQADTQKVKEYILDGCFEGYKKTGNPEILGFIEPHIDLINDANLKAEIQQAIDTKRAG